MRKVARQFLAITCDRRSGKGDEQSYSGQDQAYKDQNGGPAPGGPTPQMPSLNPMNDGIEDDGKDNADENKQQCRPQYVGNVEQESKK